MYKIRKENWNDYLHQLSTFHSITDFWSIINAVEPVNRLTKSCRYYIFKEGVSPLWEDKSKRLSNFIWEKNSERKEKYSKSMAECCCFSYWKVNQWNWSYSSCWNLPDYILDFSCWWRNYKIDWRRASTCFIMEISIIKSSHLMKDRLIKLQ
jgi:hypothetical protein